MEEVLLFCQTDNPRFSCIMYCYRYPQLTRENLEVSEFSTLCKSTKKDVPSYPQVIFSITIVVY